MTRYLALLFMLGCGAQSAVIAIPVRVQSAITAADVKSYQLWVLRVSDRDGLPVGCDGLLARTTLPGSPSIATLREPLEGNFSDGSFNVEAIPSDEGNAIFYIDLFDAPGVVGKRIGAGCKDILLLPNRTLEVRLTITSF